MFAILLPIMCVVLAGLFVFASGASGRARWIVGLVAAASFASPWLPLRVLMQLCVGLFVLLYLKVREV